MARPDPEPARVRVRPARAADRPTFVRLFAAHLAELSRYVDGVEPDAARQPDWFERPDDLFPLLVELDGRPVGFLAVLGRRPAEALGEPVDHHLFEMYVVPEVRGTGVARTALERCLAERPGTWSLACHTTNPRAFAFWNRELADRRGLRIAADGVSRTFRFEV